MLKEEIMTSDGGRPEGFYMVRGKWCPPTWVAGKWKNEPFLYSAGRWYVGGHQIDVIEVGDRIEMPTGHG